MGSELAKPDYVAHVCQSLGEHLFAFLHCGWAMTRIVETGEHRQSGSLDRFIAERLPITRSHAYSAGSAWASVLALLRASGEPLDKSDDWAACEVALEKLLPKLTTEGALVSLRSVIQRPPTLMLQVWGRSVELSQETRTKELTARQVTQAKRELLPALPASPPTPSEPDTASDVPRAEDDGEALKRAQALMPRRIPRDVVLIPEVIHVLNDRRVLDEISHTIETTIRKLQADTLVASEVIARIDLGEVCQLLAHARNHIENHKPAAPCPDCGQQGRYKPDLCNTCRVGVGTPPLGWIDRMQLRGVGHERLKNLMGQKK